MIDNPQFSRRSFLGSAAVAGALAALPSPLLAAGARFQITRTPQEWRKILSPAQYGVLREGNTERAFSSPLDREKRRGTYACAGCSLPLFSSATKFDSKTGWPSFTAPLPNAVRTKQEGALFFKQTEVHCRRCGGHLGHVFDDGPKPTGKRYCMNGLALKFSAA
ncbi:MAG TPA: peptide-methionine (R)-S-oxide reductase MsrB [Allosphingosinicella sp.]|nr:peptide-methionine (R)-S-oxide reductase MsrB [Allosphingosinicella sp.]